MVIIGKRIKDLDFMLVAALRIYLQREHKEEEVKRLVSCLSRVMNLLTFEQKRRLGTCSSWVENNLWDLDDSYYHLVKHSVSAMEETEDSPSVEDLFFIYKLACVYAVNRKTYVIDCAFGWTTDVVDVLTKEQKEEVKQEVKARFSEHTPYKEEWKKIFKILS